MSGGHVRHGEAHGTSEPWGTSCGRNVSAAPSLLLGTPLKRMQRARVPLPRPQVRVRPPRPLATGELHTGALKRGLSGRALHRGRAPCRIHQRRERYLTDGAHRHREGRSTLHHNAGRLGGEPLRYDSTHKPFQPPALLPTEPCLELSTLVGTGLVVKIQACGPLTPKEVAGPIRGKHDLAPPNINPVNLALLDVIEDRARTPALIRDRRWPEPAGAHELAATKLGQLAGQIPRHVLPSFSVTGSLRALLSLAYSGRRAPILLFSCWGCSYPLLPQHHQKKLCHCWAECHES